MVVLPPETPVTTPAEETDAMAVLALLQVDEPVVASDKVVVPPWQTLIVPVIAATDGDPTE